MKKIFQLIVSIPHDKLLHIIAGMIVVMLVLREVYNKKHGGVFDKKDLYATISGGLIVLLLTVY